MNSNRHQVPAGTLINGRYQIVRPVGQGGMAHVYLADDQQTGGQVAVKILKADLTHDPEFVKRFDTEARAASSLDHPNIVRVLGYGQDGDLRYIVQEYVSGSTLKELIQIRGVLKWQNGVPLAIQIGLALEHAHRRGVVHRDIKPQNILITPEMVAKVTDFGIARAVNTNTITLTTGVTFGSVHYFSPEQARGSLVGEKSDIYSLGIMLYEMVTGQVPFDGETSVAVAIKHLQEMPPMPSTIRKDIPRGLDNIILKCIQKSPENRYSDVRELVDELDAFMVDPDGIYGLVANPQEQSGNTTAISLNRPEPNYSKLREIERTINDRRRSRHRDMLIVVAIILFSMVFLTAIGVWGWDRIKENLKPTETEVQFEIENYIGQAWVDVKPILENADIAYRPKYEENDTVLEGYIIAQDPDAGMIIRPNSGTIVVITISGGQNLIEIPDYSGESYSKAEMELRNTYGFKVTLQYEPSEFYTKGQVIRSMPAAGQDVPKNSDIILYISDGLPTVEMPELTGMSMTAAKELLAELNLVLGPVNSMSVDLVTGEPVEVPEKNAFVIKQNPKPGVEVMARSVVGLTYGTEFDWIHFNNPTPIPTPTPTPTPTPMPTPTPEPTPTPDPTATTEPSETAPSETSAPTTTTTTATETTEPAAGNSGGNPGNNP